MAKRKTVTYKIHLKDGEYQAVEGFPIRDAEGYAIRRHGDWWSADHIHTGACAMHHRLKATCEKFAREVVKWPDGWLTNPALVGKRHEYWREISLNDHFITYDEFLRYSKNET